MNRPTTQGAVSEDARLELAMAAASAERANRPRALVVGACLLLGASIIYLLVTSTGRAAAMASLKSTRTQIKSLEQVADQILTIHTAGGGDRYRPMNDTWGYLEKLGEHVGLPKVEVKPSGEGSSGPEGFTQRSYRAIVAEQDPAVLVTWIAKAEAGEAVPGSAVEPSPGVETGQIDLTPGRVLDSGKVGWNLTVTFKRWERKERGE